MDGIQKPEALDTVKVWMKQFGDGQTFRSNVLLPQLEQNNKSSKKLAEAGLFF
jgi:hypothetical protein